MNSLRYLPCLTMIVLAAPLRAAPSDWVFTPVATVGAGGFTRIIDARVGDDGTIVVRGERDGVTGLYRIGGGAFTSIVTEGTVLPEGLGTVSSLSFEYAVDPSGRVVFSARVSGGVLPASDEFRVFRDAAGTITRMLPGDGFIHAPRTMTSNGRWIVEEITGRFPTHEARTVYLTDGTTATRVFDYAHNPSGACRFSNATNPAANAAGSVLTHYVEQSSDATQDGSGRIICGVNEAFQRTWSMGVWSPREGAGHLFSAVTFGSRSVVRGSADSGSENIRRLGLLNDAGTIAWRREVYEGSPLLFGDDNPPTRIQLVVKDAVGERVVVDSSLTDSARFDQLLGLDPVGRMAFTTLDRSTSEVRLFSGADLAKDRVLGTSDRLFGSPLQAFSPLAVNAPPNGTFGDKRIFLFRYTLDDLAGTQGIASASKQGTRWTNRNGGAWTASSNWSPEEVPGSASEVLFDLDTSYSVDVGTQRAGRVQVEDGGVGFVSADLALTGPLRVGGDASLTVAEGRLDVGELIVGHLPPLSLSNQPTARFNASGRTFALEVNGPVVVGEAGRGELFITDGSVTAAELRISALAEGAVALGLPETFFNVDGSVAVGDRAPGMLEVERGAGMLVAGDFVVGRGTSGAEPVTGVSRAVFRDAFRGSRGLANLGAGRIIVADHMSGRLEVLDGASVGAVGGEAPGALITTARTSNPAVFPDASILVSGEAGPDTQSGLFSLSGVELSAAAGSSTEVVVEDGGQFSAAGTVVLASAAGSSASVTVSGRGASGKPSLLDWSGLVSDASGSLGVDVGHRGAGVVEVLDGARMEVRGMHIGRFSGSRGRVTVGSADDGTPSRLDVVQRGENDVSGGSLTVGGTVLAGTDDDAIGILELDGGEVYVDGAMALGPKGVLRGRGSIIGPAVDMFLAGTVEPGVVLDKEISRAPGGSGAFSSMARTSADAYAAENEPVASAAAVMAAPTLRLVGKVVLQATAVVALDVAGSGQADRLVVEGPLTLGGTLVLNFANGYAPRAGDVLDLISASGALAGSFATTTINGLEPGFQFTLAPNGAGGVRLTAVNDGVSATAVGSRLSNLSVRTPLAEGQNLIVGFVVQGGSKPVLVRAAGPGLARFVGGTHPDPRITIFDPARAQVDANDSWSSSLAPVMQALGAFAFPSGSADAALQRDVATGYTAHVNGPGSGLVLVELYDAQTGVSPRLVNASARNRVGTGASVLIAGFAVDGASPKTLLVRGVGPGLTRLGVEGVLADPLLTLFSQGGGELATNDDWSGELAATFARVSAFSLGAGSKDAALLVTLAPGIYTAQVSGIGGTTGEALVEIYEVP